MRLALAAAAFLVAGPVGAGADPAFHPYETRGPLIKEGQGGERVTIDGIDVWNQGDPPRRYQILGTITDTRCNCDGLFKKHISALNEDIAKTTKAAGGDAAVVDTATNVISEVYSKDYGDGDVRTFATKDHVSRYFVVKYLPDLPSPNGPQPAQ